MGKKAKSERIQIRLDANEKQALKEYAEATGLDFSEIIRAHIRHITGLEAQPAFPALQIRAMRPCVGRRVDENYECPNNAHDDYDQCRGCALADKWERKADLELLSIGPKRQPLKDASGSRY